MQRAPSEEAWMLSSHRESKLADTSLAKFRLLRWCLASLMPSRRGVLQRRVESLTVAELQPLLRLTHRRPCWARVSWRAPNAERIRITSKSCCQRVRLTRCEQRYSDSAGQTHRIGHCAHHLSRNGSETKRAVRNRAQTNR